jgi:hypothetical protein
LISSTLVFAIQITSAMVPVGVAAATEDGELCIAMPAAAVSAGDTVTMVQPDEKQAFLLTRIIRSTSECERLEKADIPGPYYLARPSRLPESRMPWVVFAGELPRRLLASGTVAVQISTVFPSAQVRACTSSEGLHLTVWAGTPLKSDRLWHEYYYLGYDVEPSCTDRDFGGA